MIHIKTHRLKNDRARQEQLARERLERLRNKKNSQSKDESGHPDQSEDVNTIREGGDEGRENLVKLLGQRHEMEQKVRKKIPKKFFLGIFVPIVCGPMFEPFISEMF